VLQLPALFLQDSVDKTYKDTHNLSITLGEENWNYLGLLFCYDGCLIKFFIKF